VSSANSDRNFDLRCKVREGLIDFLQREQPDALPRLRASLQSFAPRVAVNEPATARDVASVGG